MGWTNSTLYWVPTKRRSTHGKDAPTYALWSRSGSLPDLEAPQLILTERRQFRNHTDQPLISRQCPLGSKHIRAESTIR